MEKTANAEKDTWILELPAEMCRREGFAEGTLVSLTIKNGGIQTSFIKPPLKKLQEISKRLLKENHELYEELKRLATENVIYLNYNESSRNGLAVESDTWKVDEIENWLRNKIVKS